MNRNEPQALPRPANPDAIPPDSSDGHAVELYLQAISRIEPLRERLQFEVADRLRRGDPNAREQAVRAYLRLVVDLARNYETAGLPLLDLISEGNLGLLQAIERFDPASGKPLATQAAQGIVRAIDEALANRSPTPSP